MNGKVVFRKEREKFGFCMEKCMRKRGEIGTVFARFAALRPMPFPSMSLLQTLLHQKTFTSKMYLT